MGGPFMGLYGFMIVSWTGDCSIIKASTRLAISSMVSMDRNFSYYKRQYQWP
jgi:hypothetical protein